MYTFLSFKLIRSWGPKLVSSGGWFAVEAVGRLAAAMAAAERR